MYVLRSHLDLSNALAVWHSPGRFRICQNVYTTRFHWQVFASQQWVAQSSHQEFNGRVYLNSDLPLNADGKSICLPVVIIARLCSLTTGTITGYWVKKFSGCWSGPPQTDHNCHLFTQSRRHGDICTGRDEPEIHHHHHWHHHWHRFGCSLHVHSALTDRRSSYCWAILERQKNS